MLGMARRLNIPILLSSTSEIYGDPQISPQDENYWGNVNPIGIRSCYDEGKRASETLCFDYLRQHEVDARIIRIFNTYGPNMDPADGRVVSNFINQAIRNEPITIYGTGSQTRSFCFVSDLIDVIIKTMATNDSFTGPVNIGNPREFTMLELANLVISITGSTSEIVYEKLPSDDPKQRQPDITRAKNHLQWQPKVDLETGLTHTISYFKGLVSC